jgi:arabinan endo-1,5-alpha-L-arabinosidase
MNDDDIRPDGARRRTRRTRSRWASVGAGAAVIGGVGWVGPAVARADSTAAPLADPDVVWFGGEHDYLFGTSYSGSDGCGNPSPDHWLVPYTRAPAGSGTDSTFDGACVLGDALVPPATGWWAEAEAGVWAPSVVEFDGRWHMYFAGKVAGTGDPGHRCVGHAVADDVAGPYVPDDGPWACPADGRWTLDPDAKVIDGRIVVAYRDDSVTTGDQTGISIVAADGDGRALDSTRRTALTSAGTGEWAWNGPHTAKVIENPTLVERPGGGGWDLFFSGGEWNSADYGTGVASCGPDVLAATACKTVGSPSSPYFGYSGGRYGAQHLLPGDHPGPGGMDVYRGAWGLRAAWHWWAGGGVRYVRTSSLAWKQADSGRYQVGTAP